MGAFSQSAPAICNVRPHVFKTIRGTYSIFLAASQRLMNFYEKLLTAHNLKI